VLGTMAVNVSTSAHQIGTFAEFEKYQLMKIEPDEEKALEYSIRLLQVKDLKHRSKIQREKLLAEKIDMTEYLGSIFRECNR